MHNVGQSTMLLMGVSNCFKFSRRQFGMEYDKNLKMLIPFCLVILLLRLLP